MIESTAILLVMGVAFALASNQFVERCLGLKLASDGLAILVLAYSGPHDNGDIRAMCMTIIALSTGLIFLSLVVGRRFFGQKQKEI